MRTMMGKTAATSSCNYRLLFNTLMTQLGTTRPTQAQVEVFTPTNGISAEPAPTSWTSAPVSTMTRRRRAKRISISSSARSSKDNDPSHHRYHRFDYWYNSILKLLLLSKDYKFYQYAFVFIRALIAVLLFFFTNRRLIFKKSYSDMSSY